VTSEQSVSTLALGKLWSNGLLAKAWVVQAFHRPVERPSNVPKASGGQLGVAAQSKFFVETKSSNLLKIKEN
jgi:hypothetical protein